MTTRYANAKDVLPAALLRSVQRHWAGLLWIPAPVRRHHKTRFDLKRNARIYRARLRGARVRDLADQFRLSRVQIWKILKKWRSGA